MALMVSPFCNPIFPNIELGRIAYNLNPFGVPSLIGGTTLAAVAGMVVLVSSFSTSERSTVQLFPEQLTPEVISLGSPVSGAGAGGATAATAVGAGGAAPSISRYSSCPEFRK